MTFKIEQPNQSLKQSIQDKIDLKTKPLGALGKLEKIAAQIALIQQNLHPELKKPHVVVFAGDHGIAKEGVSAYPQEVTFQMVMNFLQGGAAINVFCRQNDVDIKIVDAGVNYDFNNIEGLLKVKVNHGTRNFLKESALTKEELNQCFEKGKSIVDEIADQGSNIIGFGEMGIGNTSSASMIMHRLTGLPLEQCCGKGTGLTDEQLAKKVSLLASANKRVNGKTLSPTEVLQEFGGYEIAMMTAAMLQAAARKMIVLVDGFIATAAFMCAYKINENVKDYAIFCHQSNEYGHRYLLDQLEADPVLSLDMRLGEGTGCALAYPIIKSAVTFFNEMASFESAGVSNKG